MAKVIALIGSLRTESLNRAVFNEYREIAKDYFTMEEARIADLPLYNADIKPEPKRISEISQQILTSDGVLFFSPEYNYSIPGVLKNAIDWLSRCENKPFQQKPASVIGASPGQLGTARMQYHLRQVAVFIDLLFMNKPEIMINSANDKVVNGKIVDEKTLIFLADHAKQFAAFINKK